MSPDKTTNGGSRRRPGGLRRDDVPLGGVVGIGLTYFVLVPHTFPHPVHWLFSGAGGLAGAVGIWLYVERARLVARVKARWPRRSAAEPPQAGGRRGPKAGPTS